MYSIKRYDDVNAIIKRMIWLFAEEQKEMWLLASEWLATPAIVYSYSKSGSAGKAFGDFTEHRLIKNEFRC